MSNNKGKLVLYSGASGVGKGTVFAAVKERNPLVRLSVSNTTRKPRKGEIDGVHYNFITREEFEDLIKQDGYLEYAEYCDNFYGTPKKQVEDMLNSGYDVFLEIEVQGAMNVKKQYPNALLIFVTAPDANSLKERLTDREKGSGLQL